MVEPTPLTLEQKAEFKKKGEEYKILKRDTENLISGLRIQINDLEKQLKYSVSRTPNGRLFCEGCNVQSVAYLGRTAQGGDSGGDDIYECEICGKSNFGGLSFH